MIELDPEIERFISERRVARLATADAGGRPQVVPICYVFDGDAFFSPLDEKPKSVEPFKLRRVRNIEQNPQVSLVIDEYSENWSKLVYVLVDGKAEIIQTVHRDHQRAVLLLREKYSQYRWMAIGARPMIRIVPERVSRWQGNQK